jgi:hypothetical protein
MTRVLFPALVLLIAVPSQCRADGSVEGIVRAVGPNTITFGITAKEGVTYRLSADFIQNGPRPDSPGPDGLCYQLYQGRFQDVQPGMEVVIWLRGANQNRIGIGVRILPKGTLKKPLHGG